MDNSKNKSYLPGGYNNTNSVYKEEINNFLEINYPTINDLKNAAKDYHDLSMVAMPLGKESDGKKPLLLGWTKLTLNSEINWSNATNIGIITGKVSNIICLDIDREKRNDKNELISLDALPIFEKLIEKYGLPACPIQETGSGGRHYIFSYNDSIDILNKSNSKLIEMNGVKIGFDLKTTGGQIVVAPSINLRTKKSYKWLVGFCDIDNIPEIPEWIIQMLTFGGIDNNYNFIDINDAKFKYNNKTYHDSNRRNMDNTPEQYLFILLDLMDPTEFQNYNSWFEKGCIIYNFYNGDYDKTCDIWDKYSEIHNNGNYNYEEICKKIKTMRSDGVRVGLNKLEELARKYHLNEFIKIYKLHKKHMYNGEFNDHFADISRGDEGLSDIFVNIAKDDIKTFDTQNNCYMWDDKTRLWGKHHKTHIMNRISVVLEVVIAEEIHKLQDVLNEIKNYENMDDDDKENEIKEYTDMINIAFKALKYVLSTAGSTNICTKTGPKLMDENFILKLNSQHADLLPIKNNNVVHLPTGNIMCRTREHYFSFECPVEVDHDIEKLKEVDEFMLSICKNDEHLKTYLQRQLGYFITGETTERCFFIWWGSGHNGKTTLADTLLSKILDKFWVTTTQDVFMQTDDGKKASGGASPHLLCLNGARMAILSETEKGEKINSVQIKKLSGNDRIKARNLYSTTYMEFTPVCKLILLTNPKPEMDANDDALMDRFKFMPFLQKFERTSTDNSIIRDDKLVRKMQTTYLNSVFTWILYGSVKWYNEGLGILPDIVVAETNTYIRELNTVEEYLNTCFIITHDVFDTIGSTDLYNCYKNWCLENGKSNKTINDFRKGAIKKFGETKKIDGIMQYRYVKFTELET